MKLWTEIVLTFIICTLLSYIYGLFVGPLASGCMAFGWTIFVLLMILLPNPEHVAFTASLQVVQLNSWKAFRIRAKDAMIWIFFFSPGCVAATYVP